MAHNEQTPPTGFGRAFAAPVRAVTRMFAPAMSTGTTKPARAGGAIVNCGYYVAGVRQPGDIDYAQALQNAREREDAFVWLGLHEPDLDDFADIAAVFELDEFAVEDAAKGGQRAKVEQSGAITFVVVRTARYIEHAELTETSEIVETG